MRSLYLNDRFFYAMAICIGLFMLSYSMSPVYYFALVFFCLIILAIVVELVLLYKGRNVSIVRNVPSIFSLHEQNEVELIIKNEKKRALSLRVIDEIPHQFNTRDLIFRPTIKAGEENIIRYKLVPAARGAYKFGDLQVFAGTAIGLVSRRETTSAEKMIAVYPSVMQMAKQQRLVLSNPSFSTGDNKNRRIGQSYEFDQVKAYVPGDDTRNINWKASSTMREIMVNLYEDERSQQIYSIIDKSRIMKAPFNNLSLVDHAINATLAFSNIVLKKQDKAGLIIFSKQIGAWVKAERGPRQLKKIMYSLYKERYDYSEANYEALYTTVRRNVPNRSLLFLYTNFETAHSLERNLGVLRLLNKYHLLVVVFFENAGLEEYARSQVSNLLEIYQVTMARRFLLEQSQITKELERHGIISIRCKPENLSATTINKYLELKGKGRI